MKKKLIKGIILEVLSFLALILPITVLAIIKRDTWFISGANKISLGCIIALMFAVCLLKNAFKNLDKRLTALGALFVMLILTWCFDTILDDLFWIIIASIIGYGLYLIVDIFAHKELRYVKAYSDEKARVDARKQAIEDSTGGTV